MAEKTQNGKNDLNSNGRLFDVNGNGNENDLKELYTEAAFPRHLVMLGCGAIGQAILPMLLRHTDITSERIRIITADDMGKSVAERYGIEFIVNPLTPDNYASTLKENLSRGDTLLNLSVDVASTDIIVVCQELGVLYLDTSAEQWPGFSSDPSVPIAERTNYFRTTGKIHELKRTYANTVTAVANHGANPGLVSHLIKEALLHIARDTGGPTDIPKSREDWARLMQMLKVRTIQMAERDTQASTALKQPDEFVNTWSIDGFLSEATQPAEVGWGTHEKDIPSDGHVHTFGNQAALYFDRPGALTQVRSWTPREGQYHGFLITHDECMTTAEYYTLVESEQVVFRPTVMYAYHPCDDAVLSLREYAGNNWHPPKKKRILMDDIVRGSDELGVLLMGHKRRAYWYGSDLSIAQVREMAPKNQNATTMQVAAGALAALIWALENPACGICEPEDLDFRRILDIAAPYLGTVHGKYTNWTPLRDRKEKDRLFPEDVDANDPWQFKNFRVM